MTRVSLKEAYDNKDVIAQIYAIRDTAESAVDTSEQAVTTANTASDHVDALVPQVEGAVANANSASASAQASAQTVAGYENRLASVEDTAEDLAGDLNAVTLRVTTAEGDIVTIQGRVTALETADGQNVKINAINDYAVGLTGNQYEIAGYKKFLNEPFAYLVSSQMKQFNEQTAFLELCTDGGFSKAIIFEFTESSGGGRCIGKFNISSSGTITETHAVLVGAVDSIIGVVRTNGKVYLTLNGYGVFSDVYVRAGGNRRQNPVEIETPFSVADTGDYPDQLVITW